MRAALVAAEQDAGSPDAGSPDAGSPDAGSPDAGSPDAGSPDAGSADPDGPIRVTDEHLSAALDELLGAQSALTQVLLGGGPAGARGTSERPGG